MKAQYIDLVLMVKDSNSVRCFTANFCTEIRKDKSPDFTVEALCSRYGSIPGRPTFCRGVETVRRTVSATMV